MVPLNSLSVWIAEPGKVSYKLPKKKDLANPRKQQMAPLNLQRLKSENHGPTPSSFESMWVYHPKLGVPRAGTP